MPKLFMIFITKVIRFMFMIIVGKVFLQNFQINKIVDSQSGHPNKNALSQIALEERKINDLVHSLYDLSPKEISFLESEI